MSVPRGIRVLLADDHQVVREGMRMILGESPTPGARIEIVGEAATGDDADTRSARATPAHAAGRGAGKESPFAVLTPRELDVLRLVTSGKSNKVIAATLILSVGTVKGYVSAILPSSASAIARRPRSSRRNTGSSRTRRVCRP